MTDIVERLRACENDPMWADHAEIPKLWCKQAADEIEHLRAALGRLVNDSMYKDHPEASQMAIDALEPKP